MYTSSATTITKTKTTATSANTITKTKITATSATTITKTTTNVYYFCYYYQGKNKFKEKINSIFISLLITQ